VFVESVEEQRAFGKGEDEVDVDEGEVNWEDDDSFENFSEEDDAQKNKEDKEPPKPINSQLKMLQALKKREQELTAGLQELNLQRAKMSNSIGGVNKNGVKFKMRERKR